MTGRSIKKRLSAIFWAGSDSGVSSVMGANALASLALVGYLLLEVDVSLTFILVVGIGSFVFLTGCLFDRRAIWIAAGAGSLVYGAVGALTGVALTDTLTALARWVAGSLGGLLGIAAAVISYRNVSRLLEGDQPAQR